MIEEGERKLRLDLEQSQKLLNESVDKCKVWESLVNDSAEKIKKMEQEGAAMESQQMQTVESIRSSQLKLEQEYEVLQVYLHMFIIALWFIYYFIYRKKW